MKKRLLGGAFAVFLAVLATALATGLWFRTQTARDRSLPRSDVTVIIPRGASGHEVAQLLAQRRIIASPFAFEMLARLRGQRSSMKAGEYRFSAHRTASEVLQQIVTGGQAVAVWVTIPEGFTNKEIAATLAERSLGAAPAFEAVFSGESLVIAGDRTRSLEGYLFPDTYLVPTGASPPAIAHIFTDQFRAALPRDAAARAKALGLTIPQVVTVASLVEREAKVDDERALMAGVYYNRLRRGMPLQVDATIEYTFAHHKDVITSADLARDSPYNTYLNKGLPPTPIANPGRPSIEAAFFPIASDYLYYVAMKDGHSAFARTLVEHNANVAKYLR